MNFFSQRAVNEWVTTCFGPEISLDKTERNYRFLEECLELVQTIGMTREDAHKLVDYVFERTSGNIEQELGGVMVTLYALANANNLLVNKAATIELNRCWNNIKIIRAKHADKIIRTDKTGPLP